MTESEIPQNNDGEIPYLEKKRLPISWPWFFGILGILSIGVGKYCMRNEYTTLAEVFTVIGLCSFMQTLYQMRILNILQHKRHTCVDALDAVYTIANSMKMEKIISMYADMGITLTDAEQKHIRDSISSVPSPEKIKHFIEILRACKMNRVSFWDLEDVHKEMDWLLSLNNEAVTKLFKKTMYEISSGGDMVARISQEMKRDFSGYDLEDHQNLPTLLAEQLHAINERIEVCARELRERYRKSNISLEEAKQLDAEIQERIVKPRTQIVEYLKAHDQILALTQNKK